MLPLSLWTLSVYRLEFAKGWLTAWSVNSEDPKVKRKICKPRKVHRWKRHPADIRNSSQKIACPWPACCSSAIACETSRLCSSAHTAPSGVSRISMPCRRRWRAPQSRTCGTSASRPSIAASIADEMDAPNTSAPTRTLMDWCGSTYPRVRTCRATARSHSMQLPMKSTTGPERAWA